MKKRTSSLLFLCLFLVSGAFAQIKLGAFFGVHSANVTEKNNLAGWDTAYKPFYSPRTGVSLGVLADIPIGYKGFYFQPGVNYSAKGRQFFKNYDTSNMINKDSFYTVNQKNILQLGYIEIPLNLTYKINLSSSHKNKFFISAGPYLAFVYSAKMSNQSLQVKRDSNYNFTSGSTDLLVGNAVDKYKTLDFGINEKAGFEFGNVILNLYASQGLSNFYTAPYDGTFKHHVFGTSVGIWIGKSETPPRPARKVKDADNDGIPDAQDKCPNVPGLAKYNGCPVPDSDGDGINDEQDSCKLIKGVAKYNGCPIPDTDNDGIDDEHDSCKLVKGVAKYNGCPVPDTDGDGVDDDHDSCRTVKGIAKYNGCPIPDTDGDGINDEEDRCPTVPGVKENNGCPEISKEVKERLNYVAHNILFATGSTQLTGDSYENLNELVSILKKDKNLKLEIEGHTDTTGTADHNMVLSRNRANAVKNYLISSGIAEERITAIGRGQEHPVADNTTKEGKAANRRVELKLTSDK